MLTYWLFRFSHGVLAFLPPSLARAIILRLSQVVYYFHPRARRAVRSNLRRALGPGASRKELKKTSRAVFENAGLNYLDLLRLPYYDIGSLERSFTTYGWAHLEEALARGKGVVLATAHLGNPDLVAQPLVARLGKLTVLVEPMQPAALFRFVNGLRQSHGLTCLPVGMASLKEALQSLRRGEVVVVACDRNLGNGGQMVRFLGEETRLPAGAVELAMRTGAALVPAVCLRQRDGRFAAYFEAPVPLLNGGDAKETLGRNLERVMSVLEKHVRQHPEQWALLWPLW